MLVLAGIGLPVNNTGMSEQGSAYRFAGEAGPDSLERGAYYSGEDTLRAADERAREEPEFDFFAACRPRQPKITVGGYVRSNGFDVPLIDTREDWEEAFDAGVAMIRSDAEQDYDGFSGLLRSVCVGEQGVSLGSRAMTPEFRRDLEGLMRQGLHSTLIHPSEYMRQFVWPDDIRRVLESANSYGVRVDIEDTPQASLWRFVPGTNLLIFRDPAVEGRYHLRTQHDDWGYVSGWQLDPGDHDKAIQYDRTHTLSPRPIIDFYDAICGLYRFDTTHAAAVEAKLGDGGQLHFLQYLRTGLQVRPVDEFALPSGPDLIRTGDVRGATEERGEELRLYIAPRRITPEMKDQAFYLGLSVPYDRFGVQLMSMHGRAVVHNVYISLKDNHWDSSPMLRPPVAMGLGDCVGVEWKKALEKLTYDVYRRSSFDPAPPDQDVYVNVRITANGREGTIESDWQPHFVPWG